VREAEWGAADWVREAEWDYGKYRIVTKSFQFGYRSV